MRSITRIPSSTRISAQSISADNGQTELGLSRPSAARPRLTTHWDVVDGKLQCRWDVD
jgi:hypothetical protein